MAKSAKSTPLAAAKGPNHELARLRELEAVIDRGLTTFIAVGEALLEIRAKRLYRVSGYRNFDDYCREQWNWSGSYAYRTMQAAEVAKMLPIGNIVSNEAQARELVGLNSEQLALVSQKISFPDASAAEIRELVMETVNQPSSGAEANTKLVFVPQTGVHSPLEKRPDERRNVLQEAKDGFRLRLRTTMTDFVMMAGTQCLRREVMAVLEEVVKEIEQPASS